jgi:hypothetical protein
MTHTRQFADHEGDFGAWRDHPQPCNRMTSGPAPVLCGAKVQVREWESHDGAYTDYQYRCANGHQFWIDGIDS